MILQQSHELVNAKMTDVITTGYLLSFPLPCWVVRPRFLSKTAFWFSITKVNRNLFPAFQQEVTPKEKTEKENIYKLSISGSA